VFERTVEYKELEGERKADMVRVEMVMKKSEKVREEMESKVKENEELLNHVGKLR